MTTEPKMATTWEECARHVEAGGVVEYLDYQGDDEWMQGGMTAVDYRGMAEAPGKRGWRQRRLLPIEAPDSNPEGMTPGPEVGGRPTWHGTAKDAQAAVQPCGLCDGSPCDGGCRPACRHKYDGPDSHRVCRRCGGTGKEQR